MRFIAGTFYISIYYHRYFQDSKSFFTVFLLSFFAFTVRSLFVTLMVFMFPSSCLILILLHLRLVRRFLPYLPFQGPGFSRLSLRAFHAQIKRRAFHTAPDGEIPKALLNM